MKSKKIVRIEVKQAQERSRLRFKRVAKNVVVNLFEAKQKLQNSEDQMSLCMIYPTRVDLLRKSHGNLAGARESIASALAILLRPPKRRKR